MPVMQVNEVTTFTAITPLKPSVKDACPTFLPGVSLVKRGFFPEFACKVSAVLALLDAPRHPCWGEAFARQVELWWFMRQCESSTVATLVYNSNNYCVWYLKI